MSGEKTVNQIRDMKKEGKKIVMLTAYDFPFASIIDKSGVDIILVGDSLANVVLGLPSTRDVDIDVMLHHARAVNRGVKKALLVGDMPYSSYQLDTKKAVKDAKRFVEEAGCAAVKLEWFDNCITVTQEIINSGIPVMNHVGLTPQTADKLGGFKVQGKDAEAAERIMEQARALESAGCFSIVLECVPDRLAEIITRELQIPTISCGAGPYCDGQVLVTHDLVGLFEGKTPKFAKRYVDVGKLVEEGVKQFCADVRDNRYPDQAHSYSISEEELKKLRDKVL